MNKHARIHGRAMYETAFTKIETHLVEDMKRLPDKFTSITEFGKGRIEKHIRLLLSNVVAMNSRSGEEEAEDTKDLEEQSRVAVRQLIAKWAAYWHISQIDESLHGIASVDIPDKYAEDIDAGDSDDDMEIESDDQGRFGEDEDESDE